MRARAHTLSIWPPWLNIVCWKRNTVVDKSCVFPVSFMCSRTEFDGAPREMAAEFLEKPQQIAMEEKRWDQPETRETIR
jgi:hypothetical protein